MENPKKILLVGNGISSHVKSRAEWLAEHGWDVYLFTRFSESLNYQHSNIQVISHRVFRNVYIDFIHRIMRYISVFRHVKPNIVHAFYATIDNVFVVLFTSVPVVVSVWGSDILIKRQKIRGWANKTIAKWLLKRADVITAVSKQLYDIVKDGIVKDGIVEDDYQIKNKIVLQRGGVDLNLISSLKVNNDEIKRKYEIERNDIVMFSPRHIKPVYNIETVIEIMKNVVEREKHVKLLLRTYRDLPGAQEYFQVIQQKIEEYELSGSIRYVEYVGYKEYLNVLSMSDVVISVPFSDGSPVSVLEAMACKKPVICSNIPANQEIIQHRGTGIMLEDTDPQKLSDEIIHLLADKCLYSTITENAYHFVCDHADFQKEMNRMTDIYRELMRNI